MSFMNKLKPSVADDTGMVHMEKKLSKKIPKKILKDKHSTGWDLSFNRLEDLKGMCGLLLPKIPV